ncbi:xanthine phosphoribosyltransferase [Clostridium chauvoei]|uniref:Xanthine phosphoribosyltransferase n=2 Tax=Clostridium chauvoei TaxID=46867 RepID=S6ENQ4_9CLOT|nr:xanthine phosphoribosyltransferase [Clostridium chauvoei]ATD53852.1 xanthine phosphoribosyltransferase [Clostridium chauvoei]ATD58344.1 xanthine phosphoribosyltransferase [Clostridium chauvoei]MBX7280388.1 xanthine phosphoribosyltransferase [Clostridium chauvoei]MBX7282873.1 xanthine phosphoribosyltransferase [Clostridium chauvoei]MBX7285279.1 xanthine phosphoribosyltransferase [Clostridium chauvoei]
MEALKKKILEEGNIREGNILKVDCFLNHQMDIKFFNEIGKAFKERFKDQKIDKILTIEASGIGIAAIVSQYFDYVPVVFAKKTESLNLDKEVFESEVHSFTKKKTYKVRVGKNFIKKEENILIIDDFLAQGCATKGMIDIVRQAEGNIIGVGIVIEKGFQEGRKVLEEMGIRVESLAIIDRFENNTVIFK